MKRIIVISILAVSMMLSSCDYSEKADESLHDIGTDSLTDLESRIPESVDTASKSISSYNSYIFTERLTSIDIWNEKDVINGRFIDYFGEENANVLGDGKAFALTYQASETGNSGWTPVYTLNNGKEWLQGGGFLDESFGDNYFTIIEDGRLMCFASSSMALYFSNVTSISFSEDTSSLDVTELENWYDIFEFKEDKSFVVTIAHYVGNYTLNITINEMELNTNDDGNEEWIKNNYYLYSGDVVLNPETLMPVELKEISAGSDTSITATEQKASSNEFSYNELLCTIDPWSRFLSDRASGSENEVTFLDLLISDHANVTGIGKAFIITSNEDVGMHKTAGKVYYTENGGADWADAGYYYRGVGAEEFLSLPNGKILNFHRHILMPDEKMPSTAVLSFGEQSKQLHEDVIYNWFGIFDLDETVYVSDASYTGVDYITQDFTGYVIKMQIKKLNDYYTKDSDEVLYDNYVVIDKETLLPVIKDYELNP